MIGCVVGFSFGDLIVNLETHSLTGLKVLRQTGSLTFCIFLPQGFGCLFQQTCQLSLKPVDECRHCGLTELIRRERNVLDFHREIGCHSMLSPAALIRALGGKKIEQRTKTLIRIQGTI